MSTDNRASDMTTSCASCGIAEIDDVKLKECDGCDLVKYCSIECQRDHESYHEEACKKRAAELRDVLLFKQPESTHEGDCPICCLPLPLDVHKSTIYMCCSISTCNGCTLANQLRAIEMRLGQSCPFCRESATTKKERDKQRMKRVEANDPVAIRQEGMEQYNKREYAMSFEYWAKAAALGDAWAHYMLSVLYHLEQGVEKDMRQEIHHLEEAAIGGHPVARHNLGWHEYNNGNPDRAVKHFIISATQGCDDAIEALMQAYKRGFVEKEVLAAVLRAHKAAVDATKSPQREAAEVSRRFE